MRELIYYLLYLIRSGNTQNNESLWNPLELFMHGNLGKEDKSGHGAESGTAMGT